MNFGNSKIQNYEIAFLKECIDAGADGFRFDGAKHIEVPNDYENASSNFWSNVLGATTSYAKSSRGFTPYYYGEILDSTGGGQSIVNQYTNYMSVTCNTVSDNIRSQVNSGNASGAKRKDFCYNDGSQPAASKAVLWNESHDTYANGSSRGQSDTTLKKTWALVGSRAQACGMYLARPSSYSNQIGTASVTAHKMAAGTYTDQVTGNTFTVANGKISGNIGSTGVAVVYNPKPAGPSASVTPGSKTYKTNTLTLTLNYKNATSGQYSINGGSYTSFTDGKTITIGSGLAYGTKTTVSVKATDGTTTSDVQTYTYTKVEPSLVQKVYFDNSSYNWSSAYAYIYADSSTNNGEWPGVQMTKDSATGYYVVEVPEELANGYVILTESKNATSNRYPADGEEGMALNGKTMIMRANHSWEEYTQTPTTTAAPTTQPTTAQPTTVAPTTVPATTVPADKVLIGDTNLDGTITISDATEIQYHISEYKALAGDNVIAADTDKNGTINIKDATAIQYYLAGLTELARHCGEYAGGETPTTQPTTATSVKYLYYKNTNGWGTVKAYYWSDDNTSLTKWPGVDTTSVGNNTYRVEVPSEATYVIFNDGGNNKTGTLKIEGYNKIYENGSWSDYSGDVPSTTAPAGDYVYYYNSNGWSSVNAYYWSDGNTMLAEWPGVDMESVGNNVYRTKYPSAATYIIFSNNGSNQTSTITLSGANKIYKNGSWSTYNG